MFIMIVSSRHIDPFIIIKCPSLSLLTIFVLKAIFSDFSIAIPVLFWLLFSWCNFFHPFTFNLFVTMNLKCVSNR